MTSPTVGTGVSPSPLWCEVHEQTGCAYCSDPYEQAARQVTAMFARDEHAPAPQRTFAVVPVPTSRPLPEDVHSTVWSAATHQIPRAPLSAYAVLRDPVATSDGIATRAEYERG